MAVGDQCEQQPVDQLLLPGDDPPHLGFDQLKRNRLLADQFLKLLNILLFHDNTSSMCIQNGFLYENIKIKC